MNPTTDWKQELTASERYDNISKLYSYTIPTKYILYIQIDIYMYICIYKRIIPLIHLMHHRKKYLSVGGLGGNIQKTAFERELDAFNSSLSRVSAVV